MILVFNISGLVITTMMFLCFISMPRKVSSVVPSSTLTQSSHFLIPFCRAFRRFTNISSNCTEILGNLLIAETVRQRSTSLPCLWVFFDKDHLISGIDSGPGIKRQTECKYATAANILE